MSARHGVKVRGQADPIGDTVVIAYLHPGHVSHSFTDSLMKLVASNPARVLSAGGPYQFRCGPGGLEQARNQVAARFLDTSDADWLWLIDSDMGFRPDTVERLLEAADPVERPVVGGLCFALKERGPDGYGGHRVGYEPTLFAWGTKPDGESGFLALRHYPVNTLSAVAATGAACMLIHRSALQKIRDDAGDTWFTAVAYPSGLKISEDLSFCVRLNNAEIPIFVHTGVRTTHHKEFWLSEHDYWRSYRPPPAEEVTAVVVPVLDRPGNAERFMKSLRASTGLACAYAIAHEGDADTINAWTKTGATVLVGPERTFAQKVNRAYRDTLEPWLFLVGDDVSFHAGWLDHAQHVAALYGKDVIGTNDLGNPAVVAGLHATHLLVRRSYVDELGASWDGAGVVCHEGYKHNFVDNEIVTVAQQRDVWSMSFGSIVEHLHPAWGKADGDRVYEIGRSTLKEDHKLFVGRAGSFKRQPEQVSA